MLQVYVTALHILLEKVVCCLDMPKLIRDPLFLGVLYSIQAVTPDFDWSRGLVIVLPDAYTSRIVLCTLI